MKMYTTLAALTLAFVLATPMAAADHNFVIHQNSGSGSLEGSVTIYADGVQIAFYPLAAAHQYMLREYTTCDGTVITGGDSQIIGAMIEGSSAKAIGDSDWAGSWVVAGLPFVGNGGPSASAYPTGVWDEEIGYYASGFLVTDPILGLLEDDEENYSDPGPLEQVRELVQQVKEYVQGGSEVTFVAVGTGEHRIFATTEYHDVCGDHTDQ